ncbi:MAG: chromosomal replication initiator protein DnaA [Mariprofundales bacterium]|nr:chromosomal replication initiator protein DnaA [Mariprofundales bacterium]
MITDPRWLHLTQALEEQSHAAEYDAWVRNTSIEIQNNKLTILIPSRFFRDGFKQRFHHAIESLIPEYFPDGTTLHYRVKTSLVKRAPTPTIATNEGLEPRFTFENFIVGSSNEFCHAASLAVAEHPGMRYNPLYIHGGVGLGKTHLITAVANRVLANNPKCKIAFRSGERFTNDMINAIRNGKNEAFRASYREVDLLILDDVQFIAGKTGTQEEFFHTFDTLHKANKQILLTSDQPPGALKHLEERLRSRFNWGLVADVQPPDLETRLAILASKAELAGLILAPEISELLASRITSNIRELEGALTRLSAQSTLLNRAIDMRLAKEVLPDLLNIQIKRITIEDIQQLIAEYYNLRINDIKGRSRRKNIVLPRQIAMYVSKALTTMSLPEIADRFGGRDHTTVLYAVRKIAGLREQDHDINIEIDRIIARIKSQRP